MSSELDPLLLSSNRSICTPGKPPEQAFLLLGVPPRLRRRLALRQLDSELELFGILPPQPLHIRLRRCQGALEDRHNERVLGIDGCARMPDTWSTRRPLPWPSSRVAAHAVRPAPPTRASSTGPAPTWAQAPNAAHVGEQQPGREPTGAVVGEAGTAQPSRSCARAGSSQSLRPR